MCLLIDVNNCTCEVLPPKHQPNFNLTKLLPKQEAHKTLEREEQVTFGGCNQQSVHFQFCWTKDLPFLKEIL